MKQKEPKTLDGLKDEDHTKICPDCGNQDIGYDDGERFCKKCGLVLEE